LPYVPKIRVIDDSFGSILISAYETSYRSDDPWKPTAQHTGGTGPIVEGTVLFNGIYGTCRSTRIAFFTGIFTRVITAIITGFFTGIITGFFA